MVDTGLLWLSATLLLTGEALSAVLQFPHPAGGPTYEVTFENYAASGNWAAIHLGQFIASAVLLEGLLVLFFALNVSEGMQHWVGFLGPSRPGLPRRLPLSSMPLMESRSSRQLMRGQAHQRVRRRHASLVPRSSGGSNGELIAIGTSCKVSRCCCTGPVIVWTARVSRLLGLLMGVSGLAFIVLGWLTGTYGFTPANKVPIYVGHGMNDVWMIWLLIIAWRKSRSQRHKP